MDKVVSLIGQLHSAKLDEVFSVGNTTVYRLDYLVQERTE